jgi:hypothetical protein
VMEATLVSGLDVAYIVTMPDDESFPIVVTDGGPVTLEVLRASYVGDPAALDNIETVVRALLADPSVVEDISHADISDIGALSHPTLDAHVGSTANPHAVSKAQVGLSAVDNTSDAAKPLSSAATTALAGKQPLDQDLTDLAALAGVRGDVLVRGPAGWDRLAKGTAGHILKMGADDPAWAAEAVAAAAPGLTLLVKEDFSGVAAYSRNGVFSATYQNYLLVVSGLLTSVAAAITLRMRAAGVDDSSTNYSFAVNETTSAAANAPSGSAVPTAMRVATPLVGASAGHFAVELSDPAVAQRTMAMTRASLRSGANLSSFVGAGFSNTATVFDGVTVITSAGTMSGTARIYGFRNDP